MARTTRKQTTTSPALVQAPEDLKPGVVKENHTVVRAWATERTVEDLEEDLHQDEPEDDEEESEEREVAPALPEDPIEAVISEMGVSPALWTIWIERLPRYEQDGKSDPRSRKYCGSLPFSDPDYLRDERYLEDLQRHFARVNQSNHFFCSLRRNGRIRCYLGVKSVEPPPAIDLEKSQIAGQPVANANGFQQVSGNTPDPIKQMKETLKIAAEMRDMLLPPELVTRLAESRNPAPAQQPLNEQSALAALLTVDDGILEKATAGLRKFLNNGSDRDSDFSFWQNIALAAIQQKEIAAGLGGFLAALGVGFGSIIGGNGAPAAMMQAATSPPAPEPPAPTPEQALLAFLLQCLAEQAQIDLVADSVSNYVRRFPQLSPYVDRLLNTDPKIVLELMTADPQAKELAIMPGAEKWIEDLQAALDSDVEGADEPVPPEGAIVGRFQGWKL